MESRKAVDIVFSMTPLLIFLISHLAFCQAHAINTRQEPQVITGGGASPPYSAPDHGDCPDCPPEPEPVPPPPPEPECPPPLPPHPPPPPEPECPEPPPPPPKPECPEPPPPPPPPPPKPECPEPPPPPPPPPPSPPPPSPPPPRPPPPPPPPPPPLSPELRRAVKVIQEFKKTITSDPLGITKSWQGNKICKKGFYTGFICDTTISDKKLKVALVKFNGYNFDAKQLALKNFIDGLTDLIVFHANTNGFAGRVPSLSKLQTLFELDLSNNKLTGEFPPQVLAATNLTFLDLRFNKLTGKLPPQAFTLDLDVLYLNNNQFVGSIPDNLGKTPALYVTLANNNFTGTIPTSISEASSTLREILLLGNQLSGCLPYQIGLLNNVTTLFDASANYLTGPIPHSFGCLRNMQYLNISYNRLYGTVPEPLCGLGSLVKLTLKNNYITQVGPKCRQLIAKKKLDVSMNCILDLPSQRTPEECKAFFLKQKSCPDPASLNIIPCKIHYSASPDQSALGRKLMAQPRTYAALQNHA